MTAELAIPADDHEFASRSTIGMESQMEHVEGRRYRSPDGAVRYMVDAPMLGSLAERLGGELVETLKTTVVQDQRSMTTWILRKN
jgi:hypothetical protein